MGSAWARSRLSLVASRPVPGAAVAPHASDAPRGPAEASAAAGLLNRSRGGGGAERRREGGRRGGRAAWDADTGPGPATDAQHPARDGLRDNGGGGRGRGGGESPMSHEELGAGRERCRRRNAGSS